MVASHDSLPSPSDRLRLQKVLARAGVASRRHAEDLIREGRVRVNGRVVNELGTRADPAVDVISVDGTRVRQPGEAFYLALHKPAGYLTTADDPQGRPAVMSLVPPLPGLFPIGRLDAESEGLLLLTSDGEWAHHVSHPRFGCAKEYVVEVAGRPTPGELARLRRPMPLAPGEWTTGAEVRVVDTLPGRTLLRIVLHEGRNRQIRRMLDAIGYSVAHLIRVRVGAVDLGALQPGEWRHLTWDEISQTAGGADLTPWPPSPQGKGE
ncbi:MAG: pseudouridine synthase, partial [Chloroflexota bacterium]